MSRMGSETVAALREAVSDAATVSRYWAHVHPGPSCWYWTGALSGRGHGRFYLTAAPDLVKRRRTIVVIAHRFGYAATYGVDALLAVPVIGHGCDNPVCQNPSHWRESDPVSNRREWAARRREVGSSLSDRRGARGRAHAVRDAVRDGRDPDVVEQEGTPAVHRDQRSLFAAPTRCYRTENAATVSAPEAWSSSTTSESEQLGLFDEEC